MSDIVGPDGEPVRKATTIMFAELAPDHPQNLGIAIPEERAKSPTARLVAIVVPPNCIVADPGFTGESNIGRSALVSLANKALAVVQSHGAGFDRPTMVQLGRGFLAVLRYLQEVHAEVVQQNGRVKELFEEHTKQLRAAWEAGQRNGNGDTTDDFDAFVKALDAE